MKKESFFSGKVAIITGSSKGIGKAIALALANEGTAVVINGRNWEKLDETAIQLRNQHKQVLACCCDVSTDEGCKQLIDETIARFGRIDILVNNAGVSMRGRLADLKLEVVRTVFETNVLGAIGPAIKALPYLRDTRGSIVFISSLAAIRGLPYISAYSSSKMALRSFAESIRIEEAGSGIHVGLIFVGITEVEQGKISIAGDGTLIPLESRKGKRVHSMEYVARVVLSNIRTRKYIQVLTALGKLNYYLHAFFPMLTEKIIRMNIAKFSDGMK